MSRNGRGHCAVCDRIFALTYAGTVPLHGIAGDGRWSRGSDRCEGSNRAPKPGTVTAR